VRQSGLTHAYYVFAPQAVSSNSRMFARVKTAMNGILAKDPTAIQAFGVDVYPNKDLHRVTFTTLVRPWLALFRPKRLPLVVPEMGIDRPNFLSDSDRANWIRDAFHTARRQGFVNVNYYHEGKEFTMQPTERAYAAVKQGLASFQAH